MCPAIQPYYPWIHLSQELSHPRSIASTVRTPSDEPDSEREDILNFGLDDFEEVFTAFPLWRYIVRVEDDGLKAKSTLITIMSTGAKDAHL